MPEEFGNYATFTVTTSHGETVELAVMDEFEYMHRTYVAAARVYGDEIDDDGVFLYRFHKTEDGFVTEKITDKEEYEQVAHAYMEL